MMISFLVPSNQNWILQIQSSSSTTQSICRSAFLGFQMVFVWSVKGPQSSSKPEQSRDPIRPINPLGMQAYNLHNVFYSPPTKTFFFKFFKSKDYSSKESLLAFGYCRSDQ